MNHVCDHIENDAIDLLVCLSCEQYNSFWMFYFILY